MKGVLPLVLWWFLAKDGCTGQDVKAVGPFPDKAMCEKAQDPYKLREGTYSCPHFEIESACAKIKPEYK